MGGADIVTVLHSMQSPSHGAMRCRFAEPLNPLLLRLLDSTKDAGQVLCTNALETLVQVYPDIGPALLLQGVLDALEVNCRGGAQAE